jgi:hypothetical protein
VKSGSNVQDFKNVKEVHGPEPAGPRISVERVFGVEGTTKDPFPDYRRTEAKERFERSGDGE